MALRFPLTWRRRASRRRSSASSSLRRASSPARSASPSSGVRSSRAETGTSRTAARSRSCSASGTERPFSHLETVCRTTCTRSASSSWRRGLAFRKRRIFSLSMLSSSPFRWLHDTPPAAPSASNGERRSGGGAIFDRERGGIERSPFQEEGGIIKGAGPPQREYSASRHPRRIPGCGRGR